MKLNITVLPPTNLAGGHFMTDLNPYSWVVGITCISIADYIVCFK